MFAAANTTHFSLQVQGLTTNATLQVLAFEGIETISSDYAFEITLVSDYVRYDISQLLSKPAYLAFNPEQSAGINGIIQSVKRSAVGQHYAAFKVILTPVLSHLKKRLNQRVFREQSVPQIIATILTEYGMQAGQQFQFKLKESYPIREYTTQYDQTDYEFINQLAETEGIFYYFQHDPQQHKLIFADANPFFPSLAQAIKYVNDTSLVADERVIKQFDINLTSCTTEATWRNYNFATMKIPEGNAKGTQSNKANTAIEPNLESYDYPSRHLTTARAEQLAKIEIERLRATHILAEAAGDVIGLHAGLYITLTDHPLKDTEQPWLINQIRHIGKQPAVLEAFADTAATSSTPPSQLGKYLAHPIAKHLQTSLPEFSQGYRNLAILTPQDVPYRPAKLHPKPKVLGAQTAIVTGAAGEEIYCDEYGRIKIQCHWDRDGNYDENSSHWVRVASNWAHNGYGTVVIPRVGMEVLVEYEEGDPDFPVVVGAVHNGVNKVPYELPANKTKSVFKTSSSKGGVGSNEFRIEDKAGAEQIFVQAQKDFEQLTKHNQTLEVKNNSHLQVQNEHSETIIKNRYTKNHSEEHHLTQLDRKTQILMSDHKDVALAEHTSIGTIQTIEAGMEIHLKAGMQCVIDGGLSLTLKAGGQHIVLNPAGIWMTMPVWTGGVPMEGTPAVPLSPLAKENAVAPTVAPPIIYKNGTKQLAEKQTGIYKGQLHLIDKQQQPISDKYYKIVTARGTVLAEGFTDQLGKSIEVATDEGSEGKLYLGDGEWKITEYALLSDNDDCGCCGDTKFYQGKLNLIDKYKAPIANAYYKIVDSVGETLAEGLTDDHGQSIDVVSQAGENSTLYLGKGGWTITEKIVDSINSQLESDSECGC